MGTSSEALRAAVLYRSLMKVVTNYVGREGKKCHFTDFISQEFRKKCDKSDSLQRKLKLASDYTVLLKGVHYHKELLFSYNIAVDRSEEMHKVLGKSAATVGLQLPQVYRSRNGQGL